METHQSGTSAAPRSGNKKVTFTRIVDDNGFDPKELTAFTNYKSIHKKDFCNFLSKNSQF